MTVVKQFPELPVYMTSTVRDQSFETNALYTDKTSNNNLQNQSNIINVHDSNMHDDNACSSMCAPNSLNLQLNNRFQNWTLVCPRITEQNRSY